MKNRQLKTAFFILILPFLIFVFAFLLRVGVFAWEGCCTPSYPGEFTGTWWNNCCYTARKGDPRNCCSVKDADKSKCRDDQIIPCENCENGGDDEDPGTPTPPPWCTRCTLPACPNPPLSASGKNEYKLKDFFVCTDAGNGCSQPIKHYRDCYEVPLPQPSATLEILPNDKENSYGFSSVTHTGKVSGEDNINEPIEMKATYSDKSGADKMVALYIGFTKKNDAIPVTPKYINAGFTAPAKTSSKSEYAFLIRRVIDKNKKEIWVPYIPSMGNSLQEHKWVKASDNINEPFYIKGPDGKNMVQVKINSIKKEGSNELIMKFTVGFNGMDNSVEDGKYNIYLMANNSWGFLPYDYYGAYPAVQKKIPNYWDPSEIRYYNQWIDSKKVWYVDLNPPTATLNVTIDEGTRLKYEWSLDDPLGGIYGVVANLYRSETFKEEDVEDFYIVENSLTPSSGSEKRSPYLPGLLDAGQFKTGHLGGDYLFRIINSQSSGSVIIDPKGNRKGTITLVLTVFDNAGNIGVGQLSFDLRDWIATQGGLFYSKMGASVPERDFDSGWPTSSLLKSRGFEEKGISLTTELLGDSTQSPTEPFRSGENKSYGVSPHSTYEMDSYYTTFKSVFAKRKDYLLNSSRMIKKDVSSGTLTGKLDSSKITLVESNSNLVVEDFECNGKALIFVDGKLTIKDDIKNSSLNSDACIFVVSGSVTLKGEGFIASGGEGFESAWRKYSPPTTGNVTFEEGTSSGSSTQQLHYDEVNAYIFSDGTISISKESEDRPIFDGFYIGGGIHSRNEVNMKRYLKLGDRLIYPAFVVNHHSKYGILARELFGSQVNIQKTEVGFKE